jgi:CRP/FNR family transcriptional regulator
VTFSSRDVRIDPAARARLLEKSPFGGLGECASRLAALFAEKRFSAGALVFQEGDPGGQFFVLASGRLRVYRSLPGGRDITVFVLQEGASFGFLPLLDGGPFPVSVAAMGASVSLVLKRAAFQTFLRKEPEVSLRLLEHLASRLRGCLDQIGMLGQPGAHARAVHGLLSFVPPEASGRGGASVELPFSQQELARTLHVTPENLSRALAKLRKEGLLERLGPRRFRIPSLDALRRIADGD